MTTSSDGAIRTTSTPQRRGAYGQGGPVFLPQRRLSPMAEELLAQPCEVDRVTAYDDVWYQEQPRAAEL